MMLCSAGFGAETWHLRMDGTWSELGDDTHSVYIREVSKVKGLFAAGKIDEAMEALTVLKTDFPGIMGPDLDAFVEAETLYAQGKWVKAVGKYNEVLDGWPDGWLRDSAIEREFSIAVAFLNGEKRRVLKVLKLSATEEGAKIMHDIADRSGDGPVALMALKTLARSYQKRREYLDAYETWAEISSRWPTGDTGREALLEMGQSLHSAYKSPLFDHTSLISARSYYNNYSLRYPDAAQSDGIQEKIDLIAEQLAFKQYVTGTYYQRTDSLESATYYYKLVSENWPDSTAAKMSQARLAGIEAGIAMKEDTKPARKVFDAGNSFLDNWFGLGLLFSNKK